MTEKPLTAIKGVGPKRADALAKMDLHTVEDLLRLVPNHYYDFSVEHNVADLKHADITVIKVRIINDARLYRIKKNLNILRISAKDDTGCIELVWYNQPFQANQLKAGQDVYACGRIDKKRNLRMLNPMLRDERPGILPVYPICNVISQNQIRNIVRAAIDTEIDSIPDILPDWFKRNHDLMDLESALKEIHLPHDFKTLAKALRRLEFEEILMFLVILTAVRKTGERNKGICFDINTLPIKFQKLLKFDLTDAQKRVLAEISDDMGKDKPMNRMIQGDVGSGKTVPAMYAIFVAVHNGYQGVLMTPTEVLAEQHFNTLFEIFGQDVCLLKGGMKKAEKEMVYSRIKTGDANVVVGTQALLQAGVEFFNLGIVITDEQHRFGVRQRAYLSSKGTTPDVLVMSATPIPRTLALILYGDLDISVIDELPPGRKPIITKNVSENKRKDMYAFVEKKVTEGSQGYVVCPLVEQSEIFDARSALDVFEELKKMFPRMRIGLLHGQMTGIQKTETISRFKNKQIDLLVSTTVIEVGVDVPNAGIMVIENADRFGLSQLHQLRGRVGRGGQKSYCFLLSGSDAQNVKDRLELLTKTHNGFEISKKDLDLRGPGEFLGLRQHGRDTAAAKFVSDTALLIEVQKAAEELLSYKKTQKDTDKIISAAKNKYFKRLTEISPN